MLNRAVIPDLPPQHSHFSAFNPGAGSARASTQGRVPAGSPITRFSLVIGPTLGILQPSRPCNADATQGLR